MAWYSKGVCFTCKGCAHCCSSEAGYVFLSAEDLKNIPSFLSISEKDFLERHTRRVDMGTYYQLSLLERNDLSCEFLGKDGRCRIYPVRPLQCRTYPFWPYLFSDRALLEAEKANCPGIGEGRLYSESEIRKMVKDTLLDKLVTIVK